MKKEFIIVNLVCLFLLFFSEFIFAGEVYDLEKCMIKGLEESPSVNAAKMTVKSSERRLNASISEFLPSVDAGASVRNLSNIKSEGNEDTDYLDANQINYSISLNQVIYNGSRTYNSYKRSKLHKEVSDADKKLTELEVIYRINMAFFELMKARQEETIREERVRNLKENVKMAEAYTEKNFMPLADLLQARVDLEDAVQKQSIARNNVYRKRVELLSIMNMDIDSDIEFEGGLDFYEVDGLGFKELWDKAVAKRPDLDNLRKQIDIAGKSARIEAGAFLPSVKFNLGYYYNDKDYDNKLQGRYGEIDRDQLNRYWSAAVSVNLNLFDGGKSWNLRKHYLNEKDKYNFLLEERKNSIRTGIKKALFSISEAKHRVKAAKEAKKSAIEYVNMEKSRFNADISTLTDLLEAEEKLTRAESNYINAKLDYQLAIAELKFMSGDFLSE